MIGIDRDGVERWFSENLGVDGPLEFTPVQGGHSCLTFLVDEPGGTRSVLRRPPVGTLLTRSSLEPNRSPEARAARGVRRRDLFR